MVSPAQTRLLCLILNANGIPVEVEMRHASAFQETFRSSGENPEGPAPRRDGRQDGNTHRGESRVNQRCGIKSGPALSGGTVQITVVTGRGICALHSLLSDVIISQHARSEKAAKTGVEPRS